MTQTIDAPQKRPESPVQRGRAWLLRKETLGYLVLALFTVFLVVTSYLGPRENSSLPAPEFTGGSYVLTTSAPKAPHDAGWATSTRVWDIQPSKTGRVLVWTESDGSVSWTRLAAQDPKLASLQAEPLSLASGDPRTKLMPGVYLGFSLALLSFGLIVRGPRPRYGTRWFWFWLLFAPPGVGAAWFAWTELVRTPHERRPGRRSGLDGFVTMVLLSIAVSMGLWLVQGL